MTFRVFLQARLGSTRLPGKALLEFQGRPLLDYCLEALGSLGELTPVLLTDSQSAGAFEPWAQRRGWELFAGHPTNVLDRFLQASRRFPSDYIFRATGDNPLVSSSAALWLWDQVCGSPGDFFNSSGLPLGTGIEIFSSSALEKAAGSPDPYDQEHVGPSFYRHPEVFTCKTLVVPETWTAPDLRVTVDTSEDFALVDRILKDLNPQKPLTLEEIIPWYRTHQS